jgi:4-amino-4-deoxy-L-arabinose transferase-like glycosyltransferase
MLMNLWNKISSRPLHLLIATYFLFRLPCVSRLPIFNDEAIYLDWGQRMVAGQLPLFYPLFDGKQPLLMWIFGGIAYFSPDPLPAGRLVSVIAGFLCMLGIYKLGKIVGGRKTAFIAAVFYILTPIFLFYDRQALMESSVAAVGVWSFYYTVEFIRTRRFIYCSYIGLILGLGFFIKTSAMLFVFPIALLFAWSFKVRKLAAEEIFKSLAIISGVALIIVIPLLIQNQFGMIFSRNDRFALSLGEIITTLPVVWLQRIRITGEIIFWQVSPIVSGLFLYGFYIFLRDQKRKKGLGIGAVVIAAMFIPLLITLISVRTVQPRYLEPYLPVFTLAAALVSVRFHQRFFRTVVLPLILISVVFAGFALFKPEGYLSFSHSVSIATDYGGYMGGFTSGHGFNETRQFLEEKARQQPILVGVRLDAGNPESSVFAYWANGRNPNIKPIYFDSAIVSVPEGDTFNLPVPLYFVAREKHLGGMDEFLTEEVRFYKPDNKSYIGIYSLNKSQP